MQEKRPAAPQDGHENQQSRRVSLAYKAAALAIMMTSLFWLGVFALNDWWQLALAELFPATVGLISFMLARRGRLNAALLLAEAAFLAFIIGFSLMFDVPSLDTPRVTHIFLLPLAVLAYINHVRRSSRFQLVIVGASLAAFVFFSSSNFALPAAQTIPEHVRRIGAGFNAALATAMMWYAVRALQHQFVNSRRLARELAGALRNNALQLFYQPQVDHRGRIVGAEALIRWKHPKRGFIAPGIFIPAAEESGLMPMVGGWVLNEACRTLAAWKEDPALCDLGLAVNVSPSQFNDDGFERLVLDMIALHGIDPARLKLELTESVLIAGMEPVVARMEVLRAAGVAFSLDDFGTGYSSLSYLRRLPIRQLKIDRSFVQGALENRRGAALVRSIVQMGLDLDFVVLAEGVETAAQHAFLLDCGCHEFQGYHFGRPVTLDIFQTLAAAGGILRDDPRLIPFQGRVAASF